MLSLLVIGLSACSNDENAATPTPDPGTGTYVRYKLNGTLITHNLNTTACFINEYGLQVSAAAGNGGVGFEAEIAATTGTYDINAAGGLDGHFIFHRPDASIFAIERTSPGSSGTFTITKVKLIEGTKYAANGTFSGTAIAPDGTTATITEGEFYDERTK